MLNHVGYKLRVLILLLLLTAGGNACALDPSHPVSEYTVTAWSMEDGLPHNYVQTLAQDQEGYLWLGSWAGATRFNGREFTTFDGRSTPGVPLVGIRTILVESDGALLFGTAQHGVMRLANGVWSPLEATQKPSLHVISLARGRDENLWIGTDNTVWRLASDGQLDDMASAGLPRGAVFVLLDLGPEGVLIGSEHGLYRLLNDQIEPLGERSGLTASPVRALLARREGQRVVGGNAGVFVLADDARATRIHPESVESLWEDRDGALWMSQTTGGLVRHRDGVTEVIDDVGGLLGRGTPALLEDREGLLWVGTTNGLYRVADTPAFGLSTQRGLGDNYPRTILHHTDGSIYVGHAAGLDRWQQDRFEPVSLGSPGVSVLSLAQAQNGGLWIGTYDRGVLHRQHDGSVDGASISMADGLPSNHIRALRETADGSLWIGTTNGLVRRTPDGAYKQIAGLSGVPGGFVRGLAPAQNGGLWIALAQGLMRWHPDEQLEGWAAAQDFPGLGSFDVLETPSGDAFIGTDQGLVRWRAGKFTTYDRQAGLPNETLFRLLQDPHGMLWACSNHGVFRIDPTQLDEIDSGRRHRLSVDILDHASGMPSSQCNGGSGPAGDVDSTGRFWLPTALGVAVVDPNAVSARSTTRIPVRIESINVDTNTLAATSQLTLAASVQRVVFRYVSLHLRAPGAVRYRYRLLGFENDWVDAGSNTEAVYTNLPKGQLRFEVQAAMAPASWDLIADVPTAVIELERIPAFWQRTWFYALCALTIFGMLVAWNRWRSARYRSQQRRLTALIAQRTRELSDKNHALVRADRERESLLQRLAYQASHDALTGLSNRRAGDARLRQAIETAQASERPLCVAMLDLDHFKDINDTHGHDAGDALLRHIASVLTNTDFVDAADVARYGGEEFLLILQNTTLTTATEQLRRLGECIASSGIRQDDGHQLQCSASIGVAQWQSGMSAEQLISLADRHLYAAKTRGRALVMSDTQ